MTDDFCLSSEGSYISDDLVDILVCLLHKIKGKDSLSIEKLLDHVLYNTCRVGILVNDIAKFVSQ